MSQFEIYPDDGGEWRWRLKDNNHQPIAVSGEGFGREETARDSIDNVCEEVCADTPIVPEGDEKDGSAYTRFTYRLSDKNNQYYWRLQNKGNNKTIASGGEGFVSKGNVIRACENVRGEIVSNPSIISVSN